MSAACHNCYCFVCISTMDTNCDTNFCSALNGTRKKKFFMEIYNISAVVLFLFSAIFVFVCLFQGPCHTWGHFFFLSFHFACANNNNGGDLLYFISLFNLEKLNCLIFHLLFCYFIKTIARNRQTQKENKTAEIIKQITLSIKMSSQSMLLMTMMEMMMMKSG